MFGRSKLLADMVDAATKPIQEQLKAVTIVQAELERQINEGKKRAVLIDIEQEGRTLKFAFVRNGQLYQIETMSLMSADVPGWRKDLLEPLP